MKFIDQGKSMRLKTESNGPAGPTRTAYNISGSVKIRNYVPGILSMKGFEMQRYICYTKKYLLRGGLVDLAFQDIHLIDSYINPKNIAGVPLHNSAGLSLALMFFGSQHRQRSIIIQGHIMHGITLKQLTHVLSDPMCYARDDVLLCVAALTLLECFVPTGRNHYLKHIHGMERMLELRGPAIYCSEYSYHTYESIRRMIIFASLSARKVSILAQRDWADVSLVHCPPEKADEHHLFNLLVACTPVIAELDKLSSANQARDSGGAEDRSECVFQEARDLLEKLYKWKRKWDDENKDCYVEVLTVCSELGQEACRDLELLFPTIFAFSNISASTTLMFYNATLIHILRILRTLLDQHIGLQCNLSSVPYTSSEYTAIERAAATEICRCIPYHFVWESRLHPNSLLLAHFAARTAWVSFGGGGSPEGKWIADLHRRARGDVFPKALWDD